MCCCEYFCVMTRPSACCRWVNISFPQTKLEGKIVGDPRVCNDRSCNEVTRLLVGTGTNVTYTLCICVYIRMYIIVYIDVSISTIYRYMMTMIESKGPVLRECPNL